MLCWGFLSALSSNTTLKLLDATLWDYDARPTGQPQVDEQNTLDAMITKNPGLLGNVYLLPEGLFVNGIGYRHLLNETAAVAPLQGKIEPFVFHANWTVGLADKRKLMARPHRLVDRRADCRGHRAICMGQGRGLILCHGLQRAGCLAMAISDRRECQERRTRTRLIIWRRGAFTWELTLR